MSRVNALICALSAQQALQAQHQIDQGIGLPESQTTALNLRIMNNLASCLNAAFQNTYSRWGVAISEIAHAVDRWRRGSGDWSDITNVAYGALVLLSGKTHPAVDLIRIGVDLMRPDSLTLNDLRTLLGIESKDYDIALTYEAKARLRDLFTQKGEIANLQRIPPELQNDPFLSQWQCPISRQVIRFPTLIRIPTLDENRRVIQGKDRFLLCEQSSLPREDWQKWIPELDVFVYQVREVDPLCLLLEKKIHERLKEIDQEVSAEESLPQPELPWWKKISFKAASLAIQCLEDAHQYVQQASRDMDGFLGIDNRGLASRAFVGIFGKGLVKLSQKGLEACLSATAATYKKIHHSVLALPQEELDPLLLRSSIPFVRNLTGDSQ